MKLSLLILALSCLAVKANGGGPEMHKPITDWDKKYLPRSVTNCPVNVMFVLDGSDSVTPQYFSEAKHALIREIRSVANTFAGPNVGVILFSDTVVESDVTAIKARDSNQIEQLINHVNNFQQPLKSSGLSTAFRTARVNLLTYADSVARQAYGGDKTGNIIVLLTDGLPSPGDVGAVIKESKTARDNDIYIISMSIEKANEKLLAAISDSVKQYRTPTDWKSFVVCPERVLPEVRRGTACKDIMFVIDGSDSVVRQKATVKHFLQYTAQRYRLVKTAIGVNIFGTDASVQHKDTRIQLTEDKEAFKKVVEEKLRFPKSGGTGTDKAIRESIAMLRDDVRDGPAAMVVITDGRPHNLAAANQAIVDAQNQGFPVVLIRVGRVLNDVDLSILGRGATKIVSVDDFTGLFNVDLESITCNIACQRQCQLDEVFNPITCQCEPTNRVNCIPPKIRRGNGCVCGNTCPFDATQFQNTCECVCNDQRKVLSNNQCVCNRNRQCLPSELFNPNTCQCDPTRPICSAPKIPQGNICVCPRSCPAGTNQDRRTCQCTCINQLQVWRNSQCVCARTCPAGTNQDTRTCQCSCINQLQVWRNSQCECRQTTCPFGATMNLNNCQCFCSNPAKTWDQRRNQCVCRLSSSQCLTSESFNPNTCQCDPPIRVNCSPPKILNGNVCVCPRNCPAGTTQNRITCQCSCINQLQVWRNSQCECRQTTCGIGAHMNLNNCECFCSNLAKTWDQRRNQCVCKYNRQCLTSESFNQNTCQCDPPVRVNCSPPKINQNNLCVCPRTCPAGTIQDTRTCQCSCINQLQVWRNSQCECRQTTCGIGAHMNLNNCECFCSNLAKTWDQRRNQCVCKLNRRQCLTSELFNPNTCQCDPIIRVNCAPPKINQNDVCVCPRSCPFGTTQDTRTCQCSCINQLQVWRNSQCECRRNTCPFGANLNRNNCACTCSDPAKVFDPQTNLCVCNRNRQCQFNEVFNQNTCQCVPKCTNSCPRDATLDPKSCYCKCSQRGKMWEPQTNQCVCQCNCPHDAVQNNNTCTCDCNDRTKYWDWDTKKCVPTSNTMNAKSKVAKMKNETSTETETSTVSTE